MPLRVSDQGHDREQGHADRDPVRPHGAEQVKVRRPQAIEGEGRPRAIQTQRPAERVKTEEARGECQTVDQVAGRDDPHSRKFQERQQQRIQGTEPRVRHARCQLESPSLVQRVRGVNHLRTLMLKQDRFSGEPDERGEKNSNGERAGAPVSA